MGVLDNNVNGGRTMTEQEVERLAARWGGRGYTLQELEEKCNLERKALREEVDAGRKTWGRWRYDLSAPPPIVLAGGYEITLKRLTTWAFVGECQAHLVRKNRVAAEDLGNLVLILDDLERIGYHRLTRQGTP
jgi:hypothetical protein